MRSPSKGKVVGSIPAGAFLLFFFYLLFPLLSLLLLGLVAQWKRVCLLSRRLWVRPPPGSCSHSIFIHPIDSLCCALPFPLLIFPFSLFRFSYTHSFLTYMSLTALPSLSPPLSLSLPPLIGSFSLFPSLSCKQGWPSGPRRQFKVLFSSEAWVRTPPLAF